MTDKYCEFFALIRQLNGHLEFNSKANINFAANDFKIYPRSTNSYEIQVNFLNLFNFAIETNLTTHEANLLNNINSQLLKALIAINKKYKYNLALNSFAYLAPGAESEDYHYLPYLVGRGTTKQQACSIIKDMHDFEKVNLYEFIASHLLVPKDKRLQIGFSFLGQAVLGNYQLSYTQAAVLACQLKKSQKFNYDKDLALLKSTAKRLLSIRIKLYIKVITPANRQQIILGSNNHRLEYNPLGGQYDLPAPLIANDLNHHLI